MDNRKPYSVSSRGSSLSFRESKQRENNVQNCSRIGCSVRLSSTKTAQTQTLEKAKHPKTTYYSVNTKSVGESSTSQRNVYKPRSNQKSESEDIDLDSPTSQSSANSRQHKQAIRRVISHDHEIPSSSSSARLLSSTKPNNQVPIPIQNSGSAQSRYGMKKLSCSSISDVLPSNRRVNSVRKRTSYAENSLSRGKSLSVSSSSSGSEGSLVSQQASRRTRGVKPISRDRPGSESGPVSVRTWKVPVTETGIRFSERHGNDTIGVTRTQLMIPEVVPESSSISLPVNSNASVPSSSFGGRSAQSRLVTNRSGESSSHGALGDRGGYRRLNIEGIAEVLLALERIGQDDELTYEQLMVLEANLFLGGFRFHDQHRDMRMDIDNMTYEELLALEEKMGDVSTALSEEALSKCIERSTYMPAFQFNQTASHGVDDAKCSICQEEYDTGEEVGKLACDHLYHVDCIDQWLRQKNWCPICKTSAVAESSKC